MAPAGLHIGTTSVGSMWEAGVVALTSGRATGAETPGELAERGCLRGIGALGRLASMATNGHLGGREEGPLVGPGAAGPARAACVAGLPGNLAELLLPFDGSPAKPRTTDSGDPQAVNAAVIYVEGESSTRVPARHPKAGRPSERSAWQLLLPMLVVDTGGLAVGEIARPSVARASVPAENTPGTALSGHQVAPSLCADAMLDGLPAAGASSPRMRTAPAGPRSLKASGDVRVSRAAGDDSGPGYRRSDGGQPASDVDRIAVEQTASTPKKTRDTRTGQRLGCRLNLTPASYVTVASDGSPVSCGRRRARGSLDGGVVDEQVAERGDAGSVRVTTCWSSPESLAADHSVAPLRTCVGAGEYQGALRVGGSAVPPQEGRRCVNSSLSPHRPRHYQPRRRGRLLASRPQARCDEWCSVAEATASAPHRSTRR